MPPVVAPWMGSSRAIVVLPSHCRRAHAVGCGAGRAWGGAAQPASSRPESTRLAALNKAVSPLSGRQRSLGHRMLPARHQLVGAVLVQRGHEAALGLPQRRQFLGALVHARGQARQVDRKSTRLNSSHQIISYAAFCLKKKKDRLTTHNFHATKTHTQPAL